MKHPTLRRTFITAVAALAVGAVTGFAQAQTVTMHAATQFNDDHDYNRTLKRFGELVTKYYGKPVEVVIHGNSELGVERDYAKFMNQGISVDVSILAGSNMSNFTKAAPLLDVPFVFRDRAHWNAVIAKNGMKPLFDIIEQQSGMEVIGICGGPTRHLIANKPMRNLKEPAGYKNRVHGAPIFGTVCHCTFCQRMTGSSFYAESIFPVDAVEFNTGPIKKYEHTSDESGKKVYVHFCPSCGTSVGLTFDRWPHLRAVSRGCFDAVSYTHLTLPTSDLV